MPEIHGRRAGERVAAAAGPPQARARLRLFAARGKRLTAPPCAWTRGGSAGGDNHPALPHAVRDEPITAGRRSPVRWIVRREAIVYIAIAWNARDCLVRRMPAPPIWRGTSIPLSPFQALVVHAAARDPSVDFRAIDLGIRSSRARTSSRNRGLLGASASWLERLAHERGRRASSPIPRL